MLKNKEEEFKIYIQAQIDEYKKYAIDNNLDPSGNEPFIEWIKNNAANFRENWDKTHST